jgi:forkhead protein FKH
MPPRAKRKTARKSNLESQDNSDYGDSPSRPTNKKRKVRPLRRVVTSYIDDIQVNGRSSPAPRPITPSSELDARNSDETNDEGETLTEAELVEQVTASLAQAKDPILAARLFANENQQDEDKIDAFAKLAGRDWTYFVKDQSINIGREPDDRMTPHATYTGASSPVSESTNPIPVHIDLGPSKIISRLHAAIFYDHEYPEGGGWHIRVNGRNHCRVNNVLLQKEKRAHITSGTVLEIGGTQMMFVTPNDPIKIDQYFIDNMRKQAATDAPRTNPGLFSDRPELPPPAIGPGYQHLAPAPPPQIKQQRASTPPAQQYDSRAQRTVFDTKTAVSPMYGRGMMMESTQEIDYARQSAKDLKPPFSYATMIAQAIFSTEEEKMTLANIYSFISDKYAFYRHSNSGWQVSLLLLLSFRKPR